MFFPAKEHIRHVLLCEFHEGLNGIIAAKSIQSTYGNNTLNESSCRRWFSCFQSEDFILKWGASLVNRKGIILHHDNASATITRLTKDFLEVLYWKKCIILAPSDYHLYRGLLNHLDGLRLTSREEVEYKLVSYFASTLKNITSVASISLLADGMRF